MAITWEDRIANSIYPEKENSQVHFGMFFYCDI